MCLKGRRAGGAQGWNLPAQTHRDERQTHTHTHAHRNVGRCFLPGLFYQGQQPHLRHTHTHMHHREREVRERETGERQTHSNTDVCYEGRKACHLPTHTHTHTRTHTCTWVGGNVAWSHAILNAGSRDIHACTNTVEKERERRGDKHTHYDTHTHAHARRCGRKCCVGNAIFRALELELPPLLGFYLHRNRNLNLV
jgi:hypothetical protein